MQLTGRPHVEYPTRVPLKVIGRGGELSPSAIAALVLEHLGPQPEGDLQPKLNPHGKYMAVTFWVTLPDDQAERPLREAIQKLPGYVLQL